MFVSLRRIAVCVALSGVAALGCASLQAAQAYRMGPAALERGDTARAVEELERAARLMPETSEVHNQLGVAHVNAGELELALADFQRATALDCDNVEAAANLARARAHATHRLAAGELELSGGDRR